MIRCTLMAATTLGVVATALPAAAPASAATIDRALRMCGTALVSAELERDGRQREMDVEVESAPAERWTFAVRTASGRELVRLSGTTNRDGDWDDWRYLPTRPDVVRVIALGPGGETCPMRLSVRS